MRAELLAGLTSAAADMDRSLGELRRAGADAAAIAQGADQLQTIATLIRNVGHASPAALAAFREQVATTIAQSTAALSTMREAVSLSAAEAERAAAETRRQVEGMARDMFEKRIFDPYLQFASAEDEAEYRRREAEAKRYFDAELAKGTPEGDLNATGGMIAQMNDAAAHGADRSPEFKERWDALRESARKQREALRAEGKSTDEYDQRIEDSVRRFLKAKGKTDAEIDDILVGHANPLDAVEPYLENEQDARELDKDVKKDSAKDVAAEETAPSGELNANSKENTAAHNDGVFAQFLASGVSYGGDDCRIPDDAQHGLAIGKCDAGRSRPSGPQ